MKIIKIPKSFLLKDKYLKPTISTLLKLTKPKEDKVAIDFSEIQEMRKGDLLVLLAQIEKSTIARRNKIYRKGSMPSNKNIKYILSSKDIIIHENKTISLAGISDSEKEMLLNPEQIDTIVKNLKKIGIKDYYYPFNVFLTELIGNAVEHGIENQNINWWLIHEIDRKSKIAKYTFVDMGLGIIDSHKKAGLPFKYHFLQNKQVVLDALYGRLRSSTKKSYRGRGLPQLREMIENEFVSDLVLITNSVSLHYQKGVFNANTNSNFIGTYYSWTIDLNNYQKWKNIE